MTASRKIARMDFLGRVGWAQSEIVPLRPDASFRRYYRLRQSVRRAMLMDAPPDHEDVRPFMALTAHLQRIQVRCPAIYHADPVAGFLLLEDLGDDTLTRLLEAGEDSSKLYREAISLLAHIHNHPQAAGINLPDYDLEQVMQEILLFTDWYLPAASGRPTCRTLRNRFMKAWHVVYDTLPPIATTLVLRDFHVDNLMRAQTELAVLDHQDALLGSPAYDLASLLEDARRDIPPDLRKTMQEEYMALRPGLDREVFQQHLSAWSAQRHAKVAGIFARLFIRDRKPRYLRHIPRVLRLLASSLESGTMEPVADWFEQIAISGLYNLHDHTPVSGNQPPA